MNVKWPANELLKPACVSIKLLNHGALRSSNYAVKGHRMQINFRMQQ